MLQNVRLAEALCQLLGQPRRQPQTARGACRGAGWRKLVSGGARGAPAGGPCSQILHTFPQLSDLRYTCDTHTHTLTGDSSMEQFNLCSQTCGEAALGAPSSCLGGAWPPPPTDTPYACSRLAATGGCGAGGGEGRTEAGSTSDLAPASHKRSGQHLPKGRPSEAQASQDSELRAGQTHEPFPPPLKRSHSHEPFPPLKRTHSEAQSLGLREAAP